VLNIVPRLPLKLRGAKCLDLQGANLNTISLAATPPTIPHLHGNNSSLQQIDQASVRLVGGMVG
ncbi:hypothetical protein, partial [Aeromonas caviae]|uniref:hypothetical protein n=1 Tax=Aeromonas caviae TaxID=648 RepID=UPI003F745352